jgi:XTP/dITP diphosphohydrolase
VGDSVGDRLLALVAEARADGVDAEQALRDAVRRLAADVRGAEAAAG